MESLGIKLYEYRKIRGMSRRSLCEGICDVSTLYRIENGLHHPHIYTLQLLCQRLGITVNHLLTQLVCEEIQYIYNTKQRCRQLVYAHQFQELEQLIKEIEKEVQQRKLLDIDFDQFIQWHKSIILHELRKDIQQAKKELLKLCRNSNAFVTETEIGIGNSLGYIYLELHEYTKALEIYLSIQKTYEKMPFIEDKLLYVRAIYNLIYTHYQLHNYAQVIENGLKLINYLENNQLKIMIGEIHHMLGATYEKINQMSKAIEHMKKASQLFFVEERNYYYAKSLRALADFQFKSGAMEEGKKSLQLVKDKTIELEDVRDLPILIAETEQKYLASIT